MIRNEIKEYFVSVGDVSELRATAPFSLGSLTSSGALDPAACSGAVTLGAYVDFDAMPSDGELVFLRLYSVDRTSEIVFNGVSFERTAEECEQVTFDITSKVRTGVNTLEIRTEAEPLDVGVIRPVEIIKTRYALIDNVSVTQTHEGGKVSLAIRLDTLGMSESIRAVATLVSGAGQIYYGGFTKGRASITVPDPLYWWPKGLGVQNLYKLTVNVYGDMAIEDSFETRIGLRTLTTASGADGYLLEVNDTSFIPMGLTYRTPTKRYINDISAIIEADLAAAARAGVNTLVIPSDVPMPPDRFFELCDLYGIVAIRECADVPRDSDAIMRLSHHASVGIIDIISAGDDTVGITDTIHEINRDLELSFEDEPGAYPFVKAIASYRTICECLDRSERNLFSESVENSSGGSLIELIELVSKTHLYASNIYDFSYVSQLVEAAEAERFIMESRISRAKFCRAVFGSLGRKPGVVGDGLIDVRYRPTALMYRAAKFFSPVVAYAKMRGDSVEFYVSNESRNDYEGTLVYRIIDSKNNTVYKNEESFGAASSSSRLVCARDVSAYMAGNERRYVIEYSIISGNNVTYTSTLMLSPAKRFEFENPDIRAQISGEDKKFSITLTSSAYAGRVEIGFEGTDAVFHDNFIDITQNTPVKISFTVIGATTTAEKLMSELRLKSVYDIGKTYI